MSSSIVCPVVLSERVFDEQPNNCPRHDCEQQELCVFGHCFPFLDDGLTSSGVMPANPSKPTSNTELWKFLNDKHTQDDMERYS